MRSSDDVRDRVLGADFVEDDSVDVRQPMHGRLRAREVQKNIERALFHAQIDRRAHERVANLRERNVIVRLRRLDREHVMMRGPHRLALARIVDDEARAGEHLVAHDLPANLHVVREPRGAHHADETIPKLGPRVEERGGEHVAGNSPDEIEMDVSHGRLVVAFAVDEVNRLPLNTRSGMMRPWNDGPSRTRRTLSCRRSASTSTGAIPAPWSTSTRTTPR